MIFFLLRMADGFLLLVVPFGTPAAASPVDSTFNATFAVILMAIIPGGLPTFVTPGIICSTLWTTALLIAVWRRQYWARLILVALFGLAALFVLLLITTTPTDSPLFMTLVIRELVLVGSGAYMMFSRDMHRLTSRERS